MTRYDEVLKEAMEISSKERSQQAKENAACGYLTQWVVQLEQDLEETKEKLKNENLRSREERNQLLHALRNGELI